MKRRMWIILTLAVLAAALCCATALADNSGSCGDNATWTFDPGTGVLTISGTGPMEDYGYSAVWYWTENRSYVRTVVVEEGCTTIGKTAFAQLSNLTSVTLPSTLGYMSPVAYRLQHCRAGTA